MAVLERTSHRGCFHLTLSHRVARRVHRPSRCRRNWRKKLVRGGRVCYLACFRARYHAEREHFPRFQTGFIPKRISSPRTTFFLRGARDLCVRFMLSLRVSAFSCWVAVGFRFCFLPVQYVFCSCFWCRCVSCVSYFGTFGCSAAALM